MLVGPPSPDQAYAVLRDLVSALADWCAGSTEVDVIADCGRLAPGSSTLVALQQADGVLLLTRPTTDQLRPAAYRLTTLGVSGSGVRLLLVGDSPYGAAEVASGLSVEVAGVMTWDPRTAGALCGAVGGKDLRRSPLVRAAASLAQRLAVELSAAVADGTGAGPGPSAVEVGGEGRP